MSDGSMIYVALRGGARCQKLLNSLIVSFEEGLRGFR